MGRRTSRTMTALLATPTLLAIAIAIATAAIAMPVVAFAADSSQMLTTAGAIQLKNGEDGAKIEAQAKVKTDKKATKKMRAAYKTVLKQAGNGKGAFSEPRRKAVNSKYWEAYSYTVYDVDKDGSPELFVYAGSCSADSRIYAFTMKSGKAKFAGGFGDGYTSLYSGTGKAVYGQGFYMGAARVYRGTLNGTKLKSKKVVSDTAELEGYPTMAKYAKAHKCKLLTSALISDNSLVNKAKVTRKASGRATWKRVYMLRKDGNETEYYSVFEGNKEPTGGISKIKNKNPKILKVYSGDYVVARKPGKATTTFTYGGKKITLEAIVVKWEKPIASLKVGSHDYAKSANKLLGLYPTGFFDGMYALPLSGKLSVKPTKNWKITSMRLNTRSSQKKKISNGQTIKLDDESLVLNFKHKKTGAKIELMIAIEEDSSERYWL